MLTTESSLHLQIDADRDRGWRVELKRLLEPLLSRTCLLGLLSIVSIAVPLDLVRVALMGQTAVSRIFCIQFASTGSIGIAMQVVLSCAVAALMCIGRQPDFAELKRKGIGRLEILAIALIVVYWAWMLHEDFHEFSSMQAEQAWQALEDRANWLYIVIRLALSVCFVAYLRLIGSFLYRPIASTSPND